MARAYHIPVLSDQVLNYLIADRDGIFVDGTLGGGGHAERILATLSPAGRLLGIDRDQEAIEHATRRLQPDGIRCRLVRGDVAMIREYVGSAGIAMVQGILLDLGISSHQVDEAARGFSFQADAPLDMRMDQRQEHTAEAIVNSYSEAELRRVLSEYGEEPYARRIARVVVRRRAHHILHTTGELVEVLRSACGSRALVKTCARVFQALRIEVNRELESLHRALEESLNILAPGGRLVVISYHSLEDRIVKTFFREEQQEVIRSGHKLEPDRPRIPRLRILTRRPITPDESELALNPRARSAKLRAAERVVK